VHHCINVINHSPRICERCVELLLEAIASESIFEEIRQLIEEPGEGVADQIPDAVQKALLEVSVKAPDRLVRPEAVTFDFGGTILSTVEFDLNAGIERMLEISDDSNGRSVQDVLEVVNELDYQIQERRESSLFEIPVISRQRLIYDTLGVRFSLSPEEIELEFWNASMQFSIEPGITTVLDGLAARDIPMAVVSNSGFRGDVLRHELCRHGLSEYFQYFISSADYGLRKPHPFIHRASASLLNVPLSRTWHIGNSRYYDVEGAITAGAAAIYYDTDNQPPQNPKPHATVTSWIEFQQLIEKIFDI
jgi:putative hydrolase of the HAD superfamily